MHTRGPMRSAIGMLTAGLDSQGCRRGPSRRSYPTTWRPSVISSQACTSVARFALQELQEATGQPSAAILQWLALLAETRRDTPMAGEHHTTFR